MTPEDLDRIEALAKAAAPGPWSCNFDPDETMVRDAKASLGRSWERVSGPSTGFLGCAWVPSGGYDADFIAASRDAVPALVSALREAWLERDDESEVVRGAWRAAERERDEARAERDGLRAALQKAERERDEARAEAAKCAVLVSQSSRREGEAWGKLMASENAAILDGWRRARDEARAEAERLRAALRLFRRDSGHFDDRCDLLRIDHDGPEPFDCGDDRCKAAREALGEAGGGA